MRKPKVLKIRLASKCGKLSRYNSSPHLGMGTLARMDEWFRFGIVLVLGLLCGHLRSSVFVRICCEDDRCNRRLNKHARCRVLGNLFSGCHWHVFPRKTHFEKHQRKRREMEQSLGCNIFIGEIFIGDKLAVRHATCAGRQVPHDSAIAKRRFNCIRTGERFLENRYSSNRRFR